MVDNGNVILADEVSASAISLDHGVVEIGSGSRIEGSVSLASGFIDLQGAQIAGPVKLKRGRLEVRAGSHLAGGLEVINPAGAVSDSTYVVIAAGAQVDGTIHTEGLVRLLVAAGAEVALASFRGNQPEFLE